MAGSGAVDGVVAAVHRGTRGRGHGRRVTALHAVDLGS